MCKDIHGCSLLVIIHHSRISHDNRQPSLKGMFDRVFVVLPLDL